MTNTPEPAPVVIPPEQYREMLASLDRTLAQAQALNARHAAERECERQYTDELLRRRSHTPNQ